MRQYDWGQISMRGVEDGESGEPWHADVEETRVTRFVDGILVRHFEQPGYAGLAVSSCELLAIGRRVGHARQFCPYVLYCPKVQTS